MIPEIVFDTEKFSEIFEKARSEIASIYPEWTDYNYHDPGITMLELFAWLKEGQQFYMDQTGEEQKEKFLKLLGTRRMVKEPEKAILTMDSDKNMILPKGTKFYADTVCYESTEENYILKEDITKCFYAKEQIYEYIDRKQLEFGHKLKMYMFGNNPGSGDTFYIGLKESLPLDIEISVFFDLFTEYEVQRNQLKTQPPAPFIHFCVEYLTENGWFEVCELRDTTYGFLQDGQIFFKLAQEMVMGMVHQESGYFLRIRILDGVFDVPPVLTQFGINILKVEQTDHIVEHCTIGNYEVTELGKVCVKGNTWLCIYGNTDVYVEEDEKLYKISVVQKYLENENTSCSLYFELPENIKNITRVHLVNYVPRESMIRWIGEGNGYPNQTYELFDELLQYDTFELMVKEEDSESFSIWEKVLDFADSSPEDKHYILDTRTGTITFGNCMHGLAPCGQIQVISYVRTLGSNGKVKANKINKIADEISIQAVFYNRKNSWGGRREETYDESFIRIRKELKKPLTAVTYKDYENYIKETPGLMIANCKALKPQEVKEIFPYYDNSSITVVVKPYAKQPKKNLMRIYRKNILSYLEQFRMTGTSVYLIRPAYIEFEVYVEVMIRTDYLNAEEIIRETVEQYFQELNKEFGSCVAYSRLYGVIDMLSCVKQLHALSLEVKGTGVKYLADGSVQVPPHGVVELKNVVYQFSMG